jgi:hypothetical protein
MLSVKGSLCRHVGWWRENINNNFICRVVSEGYRLPLLDLPTCIYIKNNMSARENCDFVASEIEKLLSTGAINLCNEPPTIINALTVACNAEGKKRLVLDLRHVNPKLHVEKI